ncbi:MAG TPA: AI-2E family transporter [Iamia sp.]|jgi:predicted PurR-regulated permease PerM|nr:AI-2E family transporter [Iamia sp.]
MPTPSWSPHPTVLRITAYAACLVVVGLATSMVLGVLGQLALVLFPLAVALFVTRALSIPAGWLRARGWRPAPAAAVTLASALLLVVGLVALIAPPMIDEFSHLGPTVDDGVTEIEDWLVEDSPFDLTRRDVDEAEDDIVARGRDALESSEEQVTKGVQTAVSGLAGLILAVILTFFALKDGPRFVAWVDERTPEDKQRSVRAVAQAAWAALGGYLRASALLGLLEAVVIGGTMAVVGGGLVIPVMLLTFAAAFVPLVGATVAGVIAVLVTLAAGGLVPALVVAGVAVLVQQLDNDLLAPWIFGRSLELHPAVILLAIAAGTALFGFPGTVMAVPVTATVISSVAALRGEVDPEAPGEPRLAGPDPGG